MELIIVSALIVSGFSLLTYLYLNHIAKLELLIKAESLSEYKYQPEDTHTRLEDTLPEEHLDDVFQGVSNKEIIDSFKN